MTLSNKYSNLREVKMGYSFTGKNVVVTGATGGLGECIAEQFAKAGANVALAGRNVAKAESIAEVLKQYGGKVIDVKTDVSKFSDVENLVDTAVREFGSIDIMINNAGVGTTGNLLDLPIEKWDAVIDVDLKGTLYGCRAAIKYMKEQKAGKIVNIASIAGKECAPRTAAYSAAKAGVIAMTSSLAKEFAKDGININAVLPGIIRTEMWESTLRKMVGEDKASRDAVFTKYIGGMIPQGRPQEPIDIAETALFLCSEEAHNITGQNIAVDGGATF